MHGGPIRGIRRERTQCESDGAYYAVCGYLWGVSRGKGRLFMLRSANSQWLCIVALAALHIGCKKQPASAKLIAFTGIAPHSYFVQRIAGDRFETHALISPGQNPHSYSPTPEQMAKLSEAQLFFRTGIEFEQSVIAKIEQTMPDLNIVDLLEGIDATTHPAARDHAYDTGHSAHAGEEEHHHHHAEDVHIWLSPVLAKQQAQTIKDALTRFDPKFEVVYESNLQQLLKDLDSLNQELHAIFGPYEGSDLFVFHPAFGHFAQEYALRQIAVETGGKEPGAKALARLIEQARRQQPAAIFVQPQYSRKSAQTIAEQIDCAVVPINPLPADYFQEMRQLAHAIKTGLAKE
ncbi:MAG: ABC transporter substrate-binding protein [Chitinivibrionales bacterium]|nr:ABC transporter substrate-binding protein [Chitinivibrionales bacterium]